MHRSINKLLNKLRDTGMQLNALLCTFRMRVFCTLTGASLGQGSVFYGMSHFRRATGSVISIGERCRFRSTATSNLIGVNHKCIVSTFNSEARLIIGDGTGFSGTTIGCFKEIIIGHNVNCGANTVITDSDWHPSDSRSGPPKAVRIGDNVWLGYGVVVLKGVTIGENSVVGAGSVVTRDIPANVVAAGNPCVVVKIVQNG